jgi:hypothetical protein
VPLTSVAGSSSSKQDPRERRDHRYDAVPAALPRQGLLWLPLVAPRRDHQTGAIRDARRTELLVGKDSNAHTLILIVSGHQGKGWKQTTKVRCRLSITGQHGKIRYSQHSVHMLQ